MVKGVSGKKRFLVRFQYVFKKDITLNQLTIVIVEKIPVEEEPEVTTITEINEEQVTSEKRYYHGVYVIIHFNKEDSVDRKEDEANVEHDPDWEDTEDVNLDNERDCHWRMVC